MTKKLQIIMIPGIMGSNLNQIQNCIWPKPVSDIFKKSKYNKLINLEDRTITPNGTVPSIYKKIEEELDNISDIFEIFDYDWRKNNLNQVSLLRGKINSEADEIIIVAHSMGGIIAKLFLNAYKEDPIMSKIKTLITIGTPWKGAADSYKSLLFGKAIFPILSEEESEELIKCFPSAYQLFPNKEYVEGCKADSVACFREDNKPLAWEQIYNNIYLPLLKENDLDEADVLLNFYNRMRTDIPENISHYEIIGFDKPTIRSILKFTDEKMRLEFASGDGTVPLCSSISLKSNKYFVKCDSSYKNFILRPNKCDHSSLPSNKAVLDLIKNIISDQASNSIDNEIIYSYEEAIKKPFNCRVITIACPVDISLLDKDGNVLYGRAGDLDKQELFNFFYNQNDLVQNLGNSRYFILNDEQSENKFYIEGYEEGTVAIAVDAYRDGIISESGVFKTFNIDQSIKAELFINNEINKCNLNINQNSNDSKQKIILLKERDGKVDLPSTIYHFEGEKIDNKDGTFYCIGSIGLQIDNILEGTYDIKETWVNINEEKPILVIDSFIDKLELKDGENTIEVYSKDSLSNKEKSKKTKIYLFSEKEMKFSFHFRPEKYSIMPQLNNDKIYSDLNLIKPQIHISYSNDENGKDEKLGGTLLNYNNMNREFKIKFKDIFKIDREYSFVIDEMAIKRIINSDKDSLKYIEQLCENLNIDEYDIYRKNTRTNIIKPDKEGFITPDKIINAKSLFIESEKYKIEFEKEETNIVAFINLIEAIDMKKGENYDLEFKVIDKKSKQDIELDKLAVFIGIKNKRSEVKNVYKLETIYNEKNKLYKSVLCVEKLNDALNQNNIHESNFENIYLILQSEEDDTNKVLRSNQIICRY